VDHATTLSRSSKRAPDEIKLSAEESHFERLEHQREVTVVYAWDKMLDGSRFDAERVKTGGKHQHRKVYCAGKGDLNLEARADRETDSTAGGMVELMYIYQGQRVDDVSSDEYVPPQTRIRLHSR